MNSKRLPSVWCQIEGVLPPSITFMGVVKGGKSAKGLAASRLQFDVQVVVWCVHVIKGVHVPPVVEGRRINASGQRHCLVQRVARRLVPAHPNAIIAAMRSLFSHVSEASRDPGTPVGYTLLKAAVLQQIATPRCDSRIYSKWRRRVHSAPSEDALRLPAGDQGRP